MTLLFQSKKLQVMVMREGSVERPANAVLLLATPHISRQSRMVYLRWMTGGMASPSEREKETRRPETKPVPRPPHAGEREGCTHEKG